MGSLIGERGVGSEMVGWVGGKGVGGVPRFALREWERRRRKKNTTGMGM